MVSSGKWLLVGICLFTCSNVPSAGEKLLHIGGIFPINGTNGWQGGQACQPAAMLALADVNNSPNLLPGYKLNLVWNDSLCEPGLGAAVMYDLLYNEPKKLMLLGGCSTVSTTIGETAKMWNLIVLSYGSSSPALSDRKRFPTFFRTHPSATVHNPTRVTVMKKFGWSRVAILQQAEEVFISTVEDLEIECKMAGIEVITRQSFLSDPTDAIRNVKRQKARIIVGLFYVAAARRVLCEIYRNELYGKSYVWFFIGWYEDGWYERVLPEENLNCTREQMRKAAEGHLTTEALMWNQDANQTTISGMTAETFRSRLNIELEKRGFDLKNKGYPEGHQEAPLAYDAIWSIALALHRTMKKLGERNKSIDDFTYINKEIANELYSAMNATQFLGVSGRVAFSTDGSRIALTQVEQLIDGVYKVLGYYDFQTSNLTWYDREHWIGGKVPQDRTIIRSKLRTVNLAIFIPMCTISAVGMLWALLLLLFTFIHRQRRLIQLSLPGCNNTLLLGALLCLASIFFLGLDGQFISERHFPIICCARAWFLCIGFSLGYGAMFSKVWRVHRLTTNAKTESKHKPDKRKLYGMISVFVFIDIIILITWQIIDPLQRHIEEFRLETPENTLEDVRILPILEHCKSENNSVWIGIVYCYKGILLIFGLFLSYETRSIKLKQINDSKYVDLSIYNVFVLSIITAPVSLVITHHEDACYALSSFSIIVSCFTCMGLIYVPKIIEICKHPKERIDPSEVAPSKEEEERYHKLVTENEDMQKLIAEKEEKIRFLRVKIQDKGVPKVTKNSINENHIMPIEETPQTRLRPEMYRVGAEGLMQH